MIRSSIVAATLVAAFSTAASAAQINWVDWTDWNGSTEVYGSIGGVGVTFSSTANLNPAPLFGDPSDTDYWQNFRSGRDPATSAYTNVGASYPVDNIPTDTDIIRMRTAATYTVTFDQAVSDIYLAFVSLNSNSFVFTNEAILLSAAGMDLDGNGRDDNGYWGATTNASIVASQGTWTLAGSSEPHGTLVLPGTFTQLTFTGGSENWHGLTLGVTAVPLPASLMLLGAGLGGLAALRRRG